MRFPLMFRSTHEKEIVTLERYLSTNSADLKTRLRSLIETLVTIKFGGRDAQVIVGVQIAVSKREPMYLSPFEYEEYWWHIGQKITESLKAEAALQAYKVTDINNV